jgi:hypothetical protein
MPERRRCQMGMSVMTLMQLCSWQSKKNAIRYVVGEMRPEFGSGFGFMVEFWRADDDFHGILLSSNVGYPTPELAKSVVRQTLKRYRRSWRRKEFEIQKKVSK